MFTGGIFRKKKMEDPHPLSTQTADIDVDTDYGSFEEDADLDWDRQSYASTGGGSLASNVTRYRYENGRRYHAYRDGTYYAPNDEKNQSYEMVVHHLWLLTLHDKLFLAPVQNPRRILDVGSGTGLWAVDIADHFPGAEITATDLSPILYTSAPPNLTFEIDDACSEWTYPADHFDFIHIRGLTGCIRDWPYTYRQVFSHLAPGGWVEHLEFSIQTNADPNSTNHADQIMTGFSRSIIGVGDEKTGMSFRIVEQMKPLMEEAGFVDVVEEKFIWPIGAWPKDPHLKDLGRWGERNWADGIEGWVMALYTRLLGWTYAEVQAFIRDIRDVIKNRKNHFYHEVRCVYARKPFPHEVAEKAAREAQGKQPEQ
ncbi:S-adenosyl-L-methionine-dependent methyltransferase [Paraphoma chrysanthemicola]|nr:S-adenosyl-L-methionine-dependent methyltransferase [Paraphoma chrysanthemicola]